MKVIGGICGLTGSTEALERFFLAVPEINSEGAKFIYR